VINKLNAEINKVLKLPDVNATLTRQGAEVLGGTPQEFAAYIKAEIPKWAKVVKESGARAD
jgi:tripartite-type tricarboxylate transporter receptor subunit TctC